MADNWKPLPRALTHHAELTNKEREYFSNFDHEELTKSQWQDLVVLLEAVLAERIPNFNLHYTQRHENATTASRALCSPLLGPRGIAEPEKTTGFEWLMQSNPPRTAKSLLAFYFRLRELKRQQELNGAKNKLIQDLDLHPTP